MHLGLEPGFYLALLDEKEMAYRPVATWGIPAKFPLKIFVHPNFVVPKNT